jgi:hypothetical protein
MWTIASNETRALLPTWTGCVIAASIAALAGGGPHEVSRVAFAGAMLLLGAQSVGHELSHRTLGLMLTLPVRRQRLFLVKLTVVTGMVLPLVAYAWLLQLFPEAPWLPSLIAGGALVLSPALTMVSRNPLAGAILTASIPGVILTVLGVAARTVWGAPWVMERAVFETTSWLMLPVLAAAAVIGWRRFMRLEAVDGAGREIHLGWRVWPRREPRPGHPLWQLMKKELRLQQTALAIMVWCLALAGGGMLTGVQLGIDVSLAEAVTAIGWLALPVLFGSQATAEERQLGTLTCQLLLPLPAWQQWTAKAGMVFSLSLVLGAGVPALLVSLFLKEEPALGPVMGIAVVTTAAAMYISSLCATRVQAAVLSLVAIPAGFWLLMALVGAISPSSFDPAFWKAHEGPWLVLFAAVVFLLLRFAFVNHRAEPPAASRIARQALCLAALVGLGIVIVERGPF